MPASVGRQERHLRVLLLNYEYPPLGGGAGIASAALAHALAERGARVDVVTSRPGRAEAAVLAPRDGLVVHRVLSWRKGAHQADMIGAATYVAASAPVASQLLRRHRYDVAHLFFSLPTGILLPFCRRYGVPTVVSLRGSDVPGYDPHNRRLEQAHRLCRPLTRRIWRRADRVTVVCETLGQLARATEPGLAYTVVPNGVDTELFRPADPANRQPGPLRCLAVARLVERKGIADLLRAFALLDRGRYKLELVGGGPAEGALRELAAGLGLGDEVRFSGVLDHDAVAQRCRGADLFTLAPREEAFGNAFAEALAAGLPIVGTAIGGIPELVAHEENGFLAPPGDPAALAAAIQRLGSNPELRAAMAARNRTRALARLSWGAVTEQYLALYAQLVHAREPLADLARLALT